MKFLKLEGKNPYINLATEEYIFRYSDEDVFMLWQNEPTVVIGKNQNAFIELDIEAAKKQGIHVARRITGGGAVYHDLGNVNYTYISSARLDGLDFAYFTAPIIEALSCLHISATLSGRNDLLLGDKKISGNAQHTENGRVMHHGTILFDTDLDKLTAILKPDDEKIKSKAIKSIRSRVTNIKEHLSEPLTTDEFIDTLAELIVNKYSAECIEPPNDDRVDVLAKKYASQEWIYPDRTIVTEYRITKKRRFSCGTVMADIDLFGERIADIKIYGDFFGNAEIRELEASLKGKSLSELENVIKSLQINRYISGIANDELCELLLN